MSFVAQSWRNQDEYPSPKDEHSLSFWAWQFLRRNKDYQSEWKAYAEGLYRMANRCPDLLPVAKAECDLKYRESDEARREFFDHEKHELLMDLAHKQLEYVQPDPAPLPTEKTISEYANRLREERVLKWSWQLKDIALGKKWGLQSLVNPAAEKLSLSDGGFLIHGARFTRLGQKNEYCGDKNYCTPVFDLRLPVSTLRAQFEWVILSREDAIKDGTVKPYTFRPDRQLQNYREYIRVLDAVDAGAEPSEIARAMLPHQDIDGARKTVANWINAAEKLRASDYQFLPAFTELPAAERKARSRVKKS